MAKTMTDNVKFKKAVREALCEVLADDKKLRKILEDAFEDWAFGQLLERERNSKRVSRRAVFKILEGKE